MTQKLYFQAITTKWIGPTNFRPGRVRASAAAGTLIVTWDTELGIVENHRRAAEMLAERSGWKDALFGGVVAKGDYVWVQVARTDLASTRAEPEPGKWYGVSFGNGNDGVSQSHPDFYVKTDNPWILARAAMLNAFRSDRQEWAAENMEVDGEAEHGVSATLFEGPDGETEFGAAWVICEVFPTDPFEVAPGNVPLHETIEAAFDAETLALARKTNT